MTRKCIFFIIHIIMYHVYIQPGIVMLLVVLYHQFIYIYIYIYIGVCVCMCVYTHTYVYVF